MAAKKDTDKTKKKPARKSPPSGTSTSSPTTSSTVPRPRETVGPYTNTFPQSPPTGTAVPRPVSNTVPNVQGGVLGGVGRIPGGSYVPQTQSVAPTTTTTVAPKTTTAMAPTTTVAPKPSTPAPTSSQQTAPANTSSKTLSRLIDLKRLIDAATAEVQGNPQFSSRAESAIKDRKKLVSEYLSVLSTYVSEVGVNKFDAKTKTFYKDFSVPKQITDLKKVVDNPKTAENGVQSVLPALDVVNVNAADRPDVWVAPFDNVVVTNGKVKQPAAAPKEPVSTQPTGTTGGTTTAPVSGTGRRTVAGGKLDKAKVPINWEAKFREMFPANAWLVDIDPAKYPDLRKVLQDAVINRAWETTEGQTRFSAQLDGTSFFKELKTNNIVRDIKAAVGDLGFDSVPFNAFLTNAMNMGYKGDTLKQEAYKEAFRTDDNGVYVNPTAVERVKKSTPYLSVAKIGTDFFSQVSDKTIAGVLTGGMTQDDVVRQQRELAKTKYGHLSNLIDQGFSMADLAAQFQSRAATLLEVDPATIDMSQAKFETAYNFGEEGKKRMMTTGEWDRLLRTDKQFNWDQTENAKQEARKLADTISQAFGRVM